MPETATDRRSPLRRRVHEIVFEVDTRAGRAFDVGLLLLIVSSLAVIMLESVDDIRAKHHALLVFLEWTFTALFTTEYLLRLWCVRSPAGYARSFFGVVDLFSVLPTWLGLFFEGSHSLLVFRALRLLRVFRVFKLARFSGESRHLSRALWASRHKVTVFLLAVVCSVLIAGALMYLVEGPSNGFTSIPYSVYWAVVTLTTVGYGDVAPQTPLGQSLSMLLMVLGYGLIAVPTGIVSAELVHQPRATSGQACPSCSAESHEPDAKFCRKCGAPL